MTGPVVEEARQRPSRNPAVSARLPDFPWDHLAPAADRARAHPDGIVDLSVGTPVDPTPASVRRALAEAADSPGYPLTIGRVETRQAALDWMERRLGVTGIGLDGVLPTIGSKELIASLPGHLGVGPGDLVVHPELAYPTYEVGTRLAGARPLATDSLTAIGPEVPGAAVAQLPGQPDRAGAAGRRTCARSSTGAASAARCWSPTSATSSWAGTPSPSRCCTRTSRGGAPDGILAVHSLSKRSNLAGYRCALRRRRPGPGRRAARGPQEPRADDARARSRWRWPPPSPTTPTWTSSGSGTPRGGRCCGEALEGAGFRIDHSEASLYLWATRDRDCWTEVDALAELGILVAPGAFYGSSGGRHVRVAITVTDERVGRCGRATRVGPINARCARRGGSGRLYLMKVDNSAGEVKQTKESRGARPPRRAPRPLVEHAVSRQKRRKDHEPRSGDPIADPGPGRR